MRGIIVIVLFFIECVSAQNIREDLFGFATSNTFTYCDVEDTSFVNKVVALQPKLLRFPGGAVGNFYHYGQSGYGFDINPYLIEIANIVKNHLNISNCDFLNSTFEELQRNEK